MKIRLSGGGASAKDGRPPAAVMIGSIAIAASVALFGLWFMFGRDDGMTPKAMSAEGEKLVAQGAARSAAMHASAEKLQRSQKAVGEGAEFDGEGRFLGSASPESDSDLPRNRTLAQVSQPSALSDPAEEIRSGVRHRGRYSESADERGSGSRNGVVGQERPQTREAAVDRGLLTQSMLAYSTVRSAGWAQRRPEGDQDSGVAKVKNGQENAREGQERLADDRMMQMMAGLQERMLSEPGATGKAGLGGLPRAESSGSRVYPAASEAQAFPRGGIGEMTIAGGPALVVRQGKFLDCVLVNELRVDLVESPVIAMVSRDFLTADGDYVLIPAGAKLLGTAGTVQSLQQARVYLKFDRVIFPDQRSAYFPVREVAAVDGAGAVGIPGDVDRHLLLQFGAAVMLGVLDGLGAVVQGQSTGGDPTARDLVQARSSSNFATIVGSVLQRYANVMPTVTVNPGAKMKVFFTGDVRLSPYMRTRDLSWMR